MSDQVNYDPDNYIDNEDARDTKERDSGNWWPLLLIPLAFFIGWGVNEARNTANNQAYQSTAQSGVGGGPAVPCSNTSQ